jgi:D-tyrosyl-tRNA(Tyr) deacylase
MACRLYEAFVGSVRARGITVETGQFQAMMEVELVNDGPVTLLLDSERVF